MAKVKEKLSLEELLQEAIVKEENSPYEVPENWVWTTLDKVAEYKKGPFGSAITKAMFVPKGPNTYKVYEQGNAIRKDTSYGSYYISEEKYQELKGFTVASKDLIVSCAGTVGEIYQLPEGIEKGIINQALMRIKVNEKLNLKFYLWYFDESLKSDITGKSKGTAIKNIPPFAVLKAMPFPLPPLPEQQRILDIIESLFEKLDSAKELVQNALDSFENRKAAILHKAFTGELTAKWREEKGVSLDSWEEKTLKSLCKISSGGTPSRSNPEYYTGEIPWIKTGEIDWNYINNSEEKITESAIKNSSAKLFPKGTVLVAMYGQGLTRGRAAILEIEAATNQAVCALIPNSELLNQYLYYYFMCNYWTLREKAVGGNQPNFSGTMIGGFIINLPSFDEQYEIIRILDNLLENEQQAKELTDVIEKIDLMKKAILARAFRGELGTNNPEEESAIELLKEVLKEKI